MICFSVFKGLAIKCIVNGDYSEKGNPKQSDPYEEKIVECPNEITHCANITGKIAEGDLDHLPKFLEFKQSSHLNMQIWIFINQAIVFSILRKGTQAIQILWI